MSGDIFGSHNWGGRRYWHLVGGGQGCCSAPYSAQGIPPQRRTHRRRDVGGVEAWPLSPCVSVRSKVDKRPHSSSTPLCHLSVPVLFLPQVPALAPILWASLSGPPPNYFPKHAGEATPGQKQPESLFPIPAAARLGAASHVCSQQPGLPATWHLLLPSLHHCISLYCPFSWDPTMGSPSPDDG